MRSFGKARVDVPIEQIDMEEWLGGLSESTYLASAPRHFAMGRVEYDDGHTGLIEIETIATVLMIHHYKLVRSSRDRFYIISERTRAWWLNVIPHSYTTFACFRVRPLSKDACEFSLNVTIDFYHPFFAGLSKFPVFQFALDRHIQIEAKNLAQDLEAKVRAARRPTLTPVPAREAVG